jgi:pyruvate formate lyase activating enzyme
LSDAELEQIDLVLLDIKGWDSERHRHLTEKDVRRRSTSLGGCRRAAARFRCVFVLVPGLTDDAEDITQIARFCGELGVVERVDVLPFHQLGKFKWEKLGIEYTLQDVQPPTNELVEWTRERFRSVGLKAV